MLTSRQGHVMSEWVKYAAAFHASSLHDGSEEEITAFLLNAVIMIVLLL